MRLPPELLALVFVLAAEDDVMAPMIVSHVCRSWRYLALHTPSLWRRISLDPRLRMWTERIPRARACTFDVEILPQTSLVGSRTRRHYLDAQSVQLYMHMVAPYLPRWRSFTVEFQHYAPYLWNAALSYCCGTGPGAQAPRLEHLSLVHRSNDDTKEFALFGGHAPRLRSATLDGIRLSWLPSLFSNLTALDYTHHGFTRGRDAEAELFHMLTVSSRLRKLRLAFPAHSLKTIDTQTCGLPSKAYVEMEHLQELRLHVESPDIPSALLLLIGRIHCRNLCTLFLCSPPPLTPPSVNRHDHDPTYYSAPFPRLRKFLKALPRLSRLAHLHIEHSWCDVPFVIGLLNFHVPRLRNLTLWSSHVDDSVLWAIGETCRSRYRVVYTPNNAMPYVVFQPLPTLELMCAQVTEDGVLQVVRRMLGGGVIWIGELRLNECKGIGEDVIRRAERFGVKVSVWKGGKEVVPPDIGAPRTIRRRRGKW